MSLNNIDTKQVIEYKKEIEKNPDDARFTAKIEGDWLFTEGGPQFRSVVKVKDGSYTMEACHPNFAGPASRPGPMAFGLFWYAACFSSTFVTEASMQNIRLTHVKTRVEADLDYTAQFDLGKQPLVGAVRVFMDVGGDISEAQIKELREYAVTHCMGMYSVQHALPLKAEVKKI
jgi:OsmC-like protein.